MPVNLPMIEHDPPCRGQIHRSPSTVFRLNEGRRRGSLAEQGRGGRAGRRGVLTQGEGHAAGGHYLLVGLSDEAAAVGQVVEVHVHIPDVSHLQGVERRCPGAAVVPPHHRRLGPDLARTEPGERARPGKAAGQFPMPAPHIQHSSRGRRALPASRSEAPASLTPRLALTWLLAGWTCPCPEGRRRKLRPVPPPTPEQAVSSWSRSPQAGPPTGHWGAR